MPEWGKDTDVAKKEITEIKDFMSSEYGVPAGAMDQEYRSFVLLAARDAMRYRKLVEKSKTRLKEVRLKPKYTKSGVATARGDITSQRVKKARGRLQKSGRVRDFAAVLASRMAK